jgi:hypothetical protein
VIKSRKIRWAEYIAPTVKKRGAYRVLVGNPEGRRLLEELCLDGRIILKWIVSHADYFTR